MTNTLSKSLLRFILIDAELIAGVRLVQIAVRATKEIMAPRGLHGDSYELEWHVYHCFKLFKAVILQKLT